MSDPNLADEQEHADDDNIGADWRRNEIGVTISDHWKRNQIAYKFEDFTPPTDDKLIESYTRTLRALRAVPREHCAVAGKHLSRADRELCKALGGLLIKRHLATEPES